MTTPMRMAVGTATDSGRARNRNEDTVLAATWAGPGDADNVLVLAVADGMGGAEGGEIASSAVIQTLEQTLRQRHTAITLTGEEQWFDVLKAAFAAAVYALQTRSEQATDLMHMGTTLTCLVIHRGRIMFGHVGDSRAYLFRSRGLRRLTTDHNAAAELVSEGRLTPSEAGSHKSRNILTRWLAPDTPYEDPEIGSLTLEAGDLLLVCSDGLYGMVPDEEIAAILDGAPLSVDIDLEKTAAALVARANAGGGRDNISVALATCLRP
jgi:PPM family protein phosphatase